MTTTTPSTLTDRYVEATLRRVPGHQRADIERELRASIADAMDERMGSGVDRAEAETAVLTELGDPTRLAAGYADRPLHLIGPALFVDYTRLLRVLYATALPTATAAIAFVRVAQGDTVGGVITSTLGTAITIAVHIAFWTTLAFAIVERTPNRRPVAGLQPAPWTPAALPEPPSRRARYAELIGETVGFVLFTSFILLSPRLSIKEDASGRPIGVLSPWLWDTGIVYVFIAIVVVALGFSYAKYYLPDNLALNITGSLANLAAPALMIWLAVGHHILNPAFVAAGGWSADVTRWIDRGLVLIGLFSIGQTIVETVRRARRP